LSSIFIVEYNHNEVGTKFYEAWAAFDSKEGAEKGMAFYKNRYRKGTVRIRELPLETGDEDKYVTRKDDN
jgi:hypothetical protein